MLLLAWGGSVIFTTFFWMLVGVVVVGLYHALLVLPAALSLLPDRDANAPPPRPPAPAWADVGGAGAKARARTRTRTPPGAPPSPTLPAVELVGAAAAPPPPVVPVARGRRPSSDGEPLDESWVVKL